MERRQDDQLVALQGKTPEGSKKKRWTKPVLEAVELGSTAKTSDTVETGTLVNGFAPS